MVCPITYGDHKQQQEPRGKNIMPASATQGGHNDAQNRHLRTIAQLCLAVCSQLRHVQTVGKKLVKQQYLLHKSSLYGKLRPTND